MPEPETYTRHRKYRLDADDVRKLTEVAEHYGHSEAGAVRLAIRRLYEATFPPDKTPQKKSSKKSKTGG